MIVASSQGHARALARLLSSVTGSVPALAISDDPAASLALERFATSTTPWLVAVNMVSEGVDLPRLRVGVYATTVTTALYFRQVAGRLVRRRPTDAPHTPAWLYLPGEPALMAHARELQHARRHALASLPPAPATSLPLPESRAASIRTRFAALGGLAWTREIIAPAGVPGGLAACSPPEPPPFEARARLRARHHRLVGAVARRWGLAHRLIHAELTRRTGVRVHEASLAQLHERLALLQTWLTQGLR